MEMRTYQELAEDVRHALSSTDAHKLRELAEQLQALGTPQATALSQRALGNAARFAGEYALALELLRQALSASEEIGDRVGAAKATSNIGSVLSTTGNHKEGLDHLHRALAMLEEFGDKYDVAMTIGMIGVVHSNAGDYRSALEHFHRAMALQEELGDRVGIARNNGNIGLVHNYTSDYPSALDYFHRALAIYQELGSEAGEALVIGNIGNVYFSTEDYSSALQHYQRALTFHQTSGNRVYAATVTGNIGNVYLAIGDYPSALEHFQSSLELHEELGKTDSAAVVIGNMVEALFRLERFDEAAAFLRRHGSMQVENPRSRITNSFHAATLAEHRNELDEAQRHLTAALMLSTEAGLRDTMAGSHDRLRDLAQKRNDFAAYIEHNNEYNRINEEIRGKEATQKLTMMEAQRTMDAAMRERDKERALLYGALPKSVADRMIRGEDVSGDHFDNAALMFIDIVGFTSHTSHMPPSNVVKLLENIFRTLDALCDEHNVVKIKTVGDSYMCFRGDADASTNALSVARVALAVLQHPGTWPTGEPLHVRIGIHIGPATAGVIGTQRLQYDLWGDTVNVASRMESTSEPGRIHISEALAKALNKALENALNEAHIVPRGTMDIKGKGMMQTYWLESPLS